MLRLNQILRSAVCTIAYFFAILILTMHAGLQAVFYKSLNPVLVVLNSASIGISVTPDRFKLIAGQFAGYKCMVVISSTDSTFFSDIQIFRCRKILFLAFGFHASEIILDCLLCIFSGSRQFIIAIGKPHKIISVYKVCMYKVREVILPFSFIQPCLYL